MSESNKLEQGEEPGVRRQTVEGTAVMKGLAGKGGEEVVDAVVSRVPRETANWAYSYFKRCTVKVLVRALWEWGTQDTVDEEYAYFVDKVRSDSLLQAAVLDHYVDGERVTIFRDGSKAQFIF